MKLWGKFLGLMSGLDEDEYPFESKQIDENLEEAILKGVEAKYGAGITQLVSDILNADEQTIERVLELMEKNDE